MSPPLTRGKKNAQDLCRRIPCHPMKKRPRHKTVTDPRAVFAINLVSKTKVTKHKYEQLIIKYAKEDDYQVVAYLLVAARFANIRIVTKKAQEAAKGQKRVEALFAAENTIQKK